MDKQSLTQKKSDPPQAKTREKELSEAVERVYRKYGADLAAFSRDIQRQLELVKRG